MQLLSNCEIELNSVAVPRSPFPFHGEGGDVGGPEENDPLIICCISKVIEKLLYLN